jgi:hypothetical protein
VELEDLFKDKDEVNKREVCECTLEKEKPKKNNLESGFPERGEVVSRGVVGKTLCGSKLGGPTS